ncbi:hypothetical protein [Actinacidiphila acidipaludis]|uniref:Uncharacterized protein n=1 Tax=Actinacidiphila acidipaludis TaxID=2873382 RepID=A0ABS7QDQ3_9ACTN|nr:hypothetical protein [Streptomyces acidipaludis]MBY8880951.1 hypothetical protein [Streptomyces acidipaludis]
MSQDTPVPAAAPPPLPEPPLIPPPPPVTPAPVSPAQGESSPAAGAFGDIPAAPGEVDGAAASDETVPAAPRRRRGRTTLLIACAAVLGVLGGGGLGYRIQQQRTPTPLPPLTGTVLAQPKGAGVAPKPLPASQDRAAVFDSNLLAQLVPTPEGAKEDDRDWESLADYAENFTKPDGAFMEFAANDFRRAATASWTQSGHDTEVSVELVQFRDEAAPYAPGEISSWTTFDDDDEHLGDSHDVPGTMDGKVWGSAKAEHKSGYLPMYYATGLARVGNVIAEVDVNSLKPVKASTVMSVLTKQLERL